MRAHAQAGFTLVEMLVVLVIVGIMAGVTALSVGLVSRDGQAETEARLFATRVALASDEALVTGSGLSLHLDPTGYAIDSWSPETRRWSAHPNALFGPHHTLPSGVEMRAEPDDERITIAPDGTGSAFSILFSRSDARSGWRVVDDGLLVRTVAAER